MSNDENEPEDQTQEAEQQQIWGWGLSLYGVTFYTLYKHRPCMASFDSDKKHTALFQTMRRWNQSSFISVTCQDMRAYGRSC